LAALLLSAVPRAAAQLGPEGEDPVEAAAAAIRSRGGAATFVRALDGKTARFFHGSASSPGSTPTERALGFMKAHGAAFGLGPRSSLSVTHSEPDATKRQVTRLKQVVNGLPVAGGEAVVVETGGAITAAHALFVPNVDALRAAPTLTADQATDRALEVLHNLRPNETLDVSPKTVRLEYFNHRHLAGAGPGPTYLTWFVELLGSGIDQYAWVDARTGKVRLTFSQHAEAKSRNVYDAASMDPPGTLARSEGQAATGNVEVDKAYDYAGNWYDYFNAALGRDSYDNAGGILALSVRACPADYPVCPMSNAYWDPSAKLAVFGAGYATADDVVAHELTHGVVSATANLFNYMQSGALNESYADVFGETVDQSNGVGNDTAAVKWLVGEDLPGGAIRNMKDPTLKGHPGKMDDTQYKCNGDINDPAWDAGGIHSNSGVANHAYQIMVDGGTVYGVAHTAVGAAKSAAIEYRALTTYLTSASGFADNYNALNQACADLVGGPLGITAADCTRVKSALDAVKMTLLPPCLPKPVAKPLVCPAGKFAHEPMVMNEDFETGAANWGVSGSLGAWFLNDEYAASPTHDLYGSDAFGTNGGDSVVAMVNPVTIPAGARLQFSHDFTFDDMPGFLFDGGRVEYSTDGGVTWLDGLGLFAAGHGYTGNVTAFWDGLAKPATSLKAFAGQSWGYTGTQLDLATLAGKSFRLRFHIGQNGDPYGDLGWFVDDVQIYTCDPVTVSIGTPAPVVEGNAGMSPLTFPVTLNHSSGADVTVPFILVPGTATAGEDFVSTPGSVVIPAGKTSGTVTVQVKGDTKYEADETFQVKLGTPVNAVVSGPALATGTIQNDDAMPTVSIADKTITEGTGAAPAQMAFTLTLTGASGLPVTVGYAAANAGSGIGFATGGATAATAGADYVNTAGTASFPVVGGVTKTTATFNVPIVGDNVAEGTEVFSVNLTSSTNASIGDGQAVATIKDNDLPGTFTFSAARYTTGKEGVATVTITVKRTGGAAANASVDFATADGTATAGSDYTPVSKTLVFPANIASLNVTVPILNDTLAEGPEQFLVLLSNPQPGFAGAVLGAPRVAAVDIADNEPTVKFGAIPAVVEGKSVVIPITRSAGPACTVDYTTVDGTATGPDDYTAVSGTATLSGLTATFTVATKQDALIEGPETIKLVLSNAVGCYLDPANSTAVLTITDDEPAVSFSAPALTTTETAIDFKAMVSRTGTTTVPVDVDCRSSDGTARTADGDYDAASTTIHFGAGAVAVPCVVHINADTVGEGNESFKLCLSNPVGATIGKNPCATVTITDNDALLQFSAATYTVSEKTPTVTLQVKRTGSVAGTASVGYQSSDLGSGAGFATADSDYTSVGPATLNFAAGASVASFTVPILQDTTAESLEAFQVCLSAPVNATVGPLSCARVNITDDDPQLQFVSAAVAVGEGSAGSVAVKRIGPPTSAPITVNYTTGDVAAWAGGTSYAAGTLAAYGVAIYNCLAAHTASAGLEPPANPGLWSLVAPGTALAGSDYTLKSGTLTFPACGATCVGTSLQQAISIATINDLDLEPDEAFQLCLSSPTGAALFLAEPYCASVKITNNDSAGVLTLDSSVYAIGENGGVLEVTVKRTSGAASVSVDYTTRDGTATVADGDYTLTSGTLTFAGNELSRKISIPVKADANLEPNEFFSVELSNPTKGATLGTPKAATIWLINE
jgi:Zn-dependent metalloprotease